MDAVADGGLDASGPLCQSPGACQVCPAKKTLGFFNACTDSSCAGFDNARVTKTGPDGGLRPLPAVSP